LFADAKLELGCPIEHLLKLLDRSREFLSLDVDSMEKKLTKSIGFYETCSKMLLDADESLKNAFK
jgi:hypothetical protein